MQDGELKSDLMSAASCFLNKPGLNVLLIQAFQGFHSDSLDLNISRKNQQTFQIHSCTCGFLEINVRITVKHHINSLAWRRRRPLTQTPNTSHSHALTTTFIVSLSVNCGPNILQRPRGPVAAARGDSSSHVPLNEVCGV